MEINRKSDLVFECISGSRAYGLDTSASDTDVKGIYILPKESFYSFEYQEQLNDDNNNRVYYELRKFTELLAKNNPNLLEMLAMPEDCILKNNALFSAYKPGLFLSKLCKDTFAGYAMTQIKKARGLNKKILNPIEKEKKSILDFCFVISGQGSIPVIEFLKQSKLKQDLCGLVAIPHMRDIYGLYYNRTVKYQGIVHNMDSKDVCTSSVAKREKPIAVLSFNKDGYSSYCKDYKEYWEWVGKRNEVRYTNTISHGKNYDAKNMMHTFRLLDMCEEIGKNGKILVRRLNREFLLSIKMGDFGYDELLNQAEKKLESIEKVYKNANLPDTPDIDAINKLLIQTRKAWYKKAK